MELLEDLTQSRRWAGNPNVLGCLWPPPFWVTLIVSILGIAKASKGVCGPLSGTFRSGPKLTSRPRSQGMLGDPAPSSRAAPKL